VPLRTPAPSHRRTLDGLDLLTWPLSFFTVAVLAPVDWFFGTKK
jgi:hypothetical protein